MNHPLLAAARALVFDLDGVIIDSEPLHERTLLQAMAHFDIPFPPETFARYRGQTDEDVVADAIRRYLPDGARGPAVRTVVSWKQTAYRSLAHTMQAVPGALELVALASVRVPLGLATSAARENQQLAFRRFDLAPYFKAVITAEDVTAPKPDPAPYLMAADRLGVDPSNCVVLEDSLNGVISGVAAGCRVLAITTSFERAALEREGAHAVIDRFEEVLGG